MSRIAVEETILRSFGWEKIPNWECMFVHRKQGLFLSEYGDAIKMAGRKWNMAPILKKLMKHVDIDEPTPFLAHVYLGCIQRECKPNETIIEQFTKIYESCISAGATEKLPGLDKPRAKTTSCSHDMERHARKSVDRYCELANKKTQQLYKVSHLCLDDHQFKHSSRKNSNQWRIVRSLLTNCLGMLVRGTNWKTRHSVVGQQTCSISHYMDIPFDERLPPLISYIHHTSDYRQHCHVGNSAQHCRLGLCQDSDFAGGS